MAASAARVGGGVGMGGHMVVRAWLATSNCKFETLQCRRAFFLNVMEAQTPRPPKTHDLMAGRRWRQVRRERGGAWEWEERSAGGEARIPNRLSLSLSLSLSLTHTHKHTADKSTQTRHSRPPPAPDPRPLYLEPQPVYPRPQTPNCSL